MGDDLPDICILEKVGLACCPKDAVKEVCDICNFISTRDGGKGAVRELCDFILDAQGIEKDYIVAEGPNK
jgi:3-deoxy-D-manno-octulosonate 8-phosphate phosphatase (KDO 8-P phosphatase)